MASNAAEFAVHYVYRSELVPQSPIRLHTVETTRHHWFDVVCAIRRQQWTAGRPGAGRKLSAARNSEFLLGRVVATRSDANVLAASPTGERRSHFHINVAEVKARLERVPPLQSGSVLQSQDVVVVERVPEWLYAAHQCRWNEQWSQYCAAQQVPRHITYEEGQRVAARHGIDLKAVDVALLLSLVRDVRHNFVEDWSQTPEGGRSSRSNVHPLTGRMGYGIDDGGLSAEQSRSNAPRTAAGRVKRGRTDESVSEPTEDDGEAYQRPPPSHYVCRRCNVSGHWIQQCPSRTRDPSGPPAARGPLPTTGIPRAMLVPVREATTPDDGSLTARPTTADGPSSLPDSSSTPVSAAGTAASVSLPPASVVHVHRGQRVRVQWKTTDTPFLSPPLPPSSSAAATAALAVASPSTPVIAREHSSENSPKHDVPRETSATRGSKREREDRGGDDYASDHGRRGRRRD